MNKFKTEYQLVALLNKAIKFRNEFDLVNFNNAIQEIDVVEYHRLFESKK